MSVRGQVGGVCLRLVHSRAWKARQLSRFRAPWTWSWATQGGSCTAQDHGQDGREVDPVREARTAKVVVGSEISELLHPTDSVVVVVVVAAAAVARSPPQRR